MEEGLRENTVLNKRRQQVQPVLHTFYRGDYMQMDIEKIVAVLIGLLEDQENVDITYELEKTA